MKPTYGAVSRFGLVAFASSLDQIGPLGATVADAAVLYDVIAGHDPLDSTSIPGHTRTVVPTLEEGVDGLRIGIISEMRPGMDECWLRDDVGRYSSELRLVALPEDRLR